MRKKNINNSLLIEVPHVDVSKARSTEIPHPMIVLNLQSQETTNKRSDNLVSSMQVWYLLFEQ